MENDNLSFKIVKGIPTGSDLNIIENLYTEIFEDSQLNSFHKRLNEQENICSLIAFDDITPIGFKIGYHYNQTTFYSWVGGVLPDFRGKGVAKKLAQLQEQWAKKNNYLKLRTKSMNRYKPMMILNLKNGFDIVSAYTNDAGHLKIVFEKEI